MWEQYNNSGTRMYSLNLAAYLMAVTDLVPDVLKDEETNTAYFVFPECAAVSSAIKEYKAANPEVKIHDFLAAIKKLRTTMKTILER